MPEESGHRMEAGLRAWAKHRCEQAGKEFELHPASRRLLRDEVARAFPPRATEAVPWRLSLSQFWSRAVGVMGLLLVLGLAGWAGKVFWSNLPRYGNTAMDDLNPPQELAFTLRRSGDSAEDRGLATNRTDADQEEAAAARSAARDKAKASSAELLAGRSSPINGAARRNAGPVGKAASAEEGAGTVENPFALGGGAVAPNQALDYRRSVNPATGGVVALTESLGRRTPTTSSGAEKSAEVVQAQPPPATAAPTAPPAALQSTADRTLAVESRALAAAPAKAEAGLAGQPVTAETTRTVVASAPASLSLTARSGTDSPAPQVGARPQTPVLSDSLTVQQPVRSRLASAAKPPVDQAGAVATLPRYVREAGPGPVLENFAVRIEGENLSLVDADGSEYRGRFTGGTAVALDRPAPPPAAGGRTSSPAVRGAQIDPVPGTAEKPTEFYFQVTGTNRSLGQAMQLSGVFGHEIAPGLDALRRGFSGLGAPSAPARTVPGNTLAQQTTPPSTNATFVRAMLRLGTNEPQFFRAVRSP